MFGKYAKFLPEMLDLITNDLASEIYAKQSGPA
jgi:hypothetical protein